LIEIKARIFVVLAILLVAPRAFAQLSPGPLSAAHAKLDDDASCNQCHSSGKKVDQPKCLQCHTPLAKRLEAGLGLHASFGGQPCAACHVEHVGVKARLIRWPGGAPEKLDHAKAGWPLEGKHAGVACATCHDQKTPSGTVTFLGKKTVCASCHKDPHEGKFGANCQSCHNQIDFKRVNEVAIDHAKTAFPLTGKHQAVACKACHGEPPRWKGIEFASCSSCHTDPHKGRFQGTCESCHTTASWTRVRGFAAKHPLLSLANGHARVACRTCHDKGNEKPPSRGSECVSCHQQVHEAASSPAPEAAQAD